MNSILGRDQTTTTTTKCVGSNCKGCDASECTYRTSQFGANQYGNTSNSGLVACSGQNCPGCASQQCLSTTRTLRAAPIFGQRDVANTVVREQHVNQQASAPSIQEQHIVQEKHITHEQPIIEKKIIHEQPIVQQRTIIHEKPVVHEKTILHKQEQVVHEKPIFQQGATEHIREAPTVVREAGQVIQDRPVHMYQSGLGQHQSGLAQHQSGLAQNQQLHGNTLGANTVPFSSSSSTSTTHAAPIASTTTAPLASLRAEPTVLHETVSGSPVYDKSKTANAGSKTFQEDALRHQTDMNQALAGENDRIAQNLKAAAAEREILAHLDAAKAPGTAKGPTGKHTASA